MFLPGEVVPGCTVYELKDGIHVFLSLRAAFFAVWQSRFSVFCIIHVHLSIVFAPAGASYLFVTKQKGNLKNSPRCCRARKSHGHTLVTSNA